MILRIAVMFLTISAFCLCFAVTIDVPRLPASPHVDGESSADISISGKPPESDLRLFKLKMVVVYDACCVPWLRNGRNAYGKPLGG